MSVFLALTEGAKTMNQASTFACRLASKLNVDLDGVTAMPDPAGALLMTGAGAGLYMPGSPEVMEGVKAAQDATRRKLEDAFRGVCSSEGFMHDKISVQHMEGLPEQALAHAALLSDGLIFPHDCGKSGGPYGVAFEYILMSRRQPVIIAGTDEDPDLSTVVIAWDGSPENSRAIQLHERVICAADRVVIAQNSDKIDPQDEHGPEDTQRVTAWLDARGKASSIRMFSGGVADGLLRLVKEENAGVLVTGAFGHSRVEELIFGGVSRSLLRAEEGPALAIAH